MGDIVSLQAKIQAKRQGEGEVTFVLCPCSAEGTQPLVVVLHDAKGAMISHLVCPECENEIAVLSGRLEQS